MLAGYHYSHGRTGRPIVVMCHGTSATITMVIDAYAEAIFSAGFDVLLYDNRNFGQSGGEPRQEINPWIQARGYRDAVAFLRQTHPPETPVVLWGDSYTAGLALIAGALIDNVAAIIAQIPVCGADWPEGPVDGSAFDVMSALFSDGDVSGGPDQTTGPMPVVSPDQLNNPSILTPIQAFRWFIEYGGRHGSGWQNRVTRVIPATPVPCSPLITAPHLTMPVQMMIGRDDEMIHCNPDLQRAVFDRIPGEKELIEIDGGHFGLLWHPGALFNQAAKAQTDFLRRVFDVSLQTPNATPSMALDLECE